MKAKSLFLLLISFLSFAGSANAREELSLEFKNELSEDIQNNFADKLSDASLSNHSNHASLSAKDQKAMFKALYAGIEGPLSLVGVRISEQSFYSKFGNLLVKGAQFGAMPSAITIGWFSRADLVVGKSYGTEMNFYLEKGKLKVSTYDLNTLNIGLTANVSVGYYLALCYGSCTGGDVNGSYIGVDADVVFGAGANIYIEVGVDTTDFYQARKIGQSYKMSELYKTKVVYLGVGVDIGVGASYSLGFSDYEMKSDLEIMDLYEAMSRPSYSTEVKSAFRQANLFKSGPRLP